MEDYSLNMEEACGAQKREAICRQLGPSGGSVSQKMAWLIVAGVAGASYFAIHSALSALDPEFVFRS